MGRERVFHMGSESQARVNGDKEGVSRKGGGMAWCNDVCHSRKVCIGKAINGESSQVPFKIFTCRNCCHIEIAQSISPHCPLCTLSLPLLHSLPPVQSCRNNISHYI